jgi:uncharacterized NAD(P)/FAD-binding protein YdhS
MGATVFDVDQGPFRPHLVIAVVGGGASGVLACLHLLRRVCLPCRILFFEPTGRPGRGWAYGTPWEVCLLNVPAAKMGAFPEDPEDFYRWLLSTGLEPRPAPGDFVPRHFYGRYLEERLWKAQREAEEKGVVVQWIRQAVVDLCPKPEGAILFLEGGGQCFAQWVILATGLLAPSPLPGSEDCPFPLYLGNPWVAREELRILAQSSRLLAVGSGLSTLDVAKVLAQLGFGGVLHVLSPHGLLPQPHSKANPLGGPPGKRPDLPLENWGNGLSTRRLFREVRRAIEHAEDWREVIDTLRPWVPRLWQALDPTEKRRFLRHVRFLWNVHRHRAPPEDIEFVQRWEREGHWRLVVGRFRRMEPIGKARVRVVLGLPSGQDDEWIGDAVIACTGPELRWTKAPDPFWAALFRRGVARPGPLGLGIATGPHGEVLDRDGAPNPRIFAVGPLRVGDLWETTAIPEIRVQAATLARHLCSAALPRGP